MKTLVICLLLLKSMSVFGKCQEAYKQFKKEVFLSPITSTAMSTAHGALGSLSSVHDLVKGIIKLNPNITTAGLINGVAFSYEGEFYLEIMSSNFKNLKGTLEVLDIINQAELGFGDELEDFYDSLSEEDGAEDLELSELIDFINEANQEYLLCSGEQSDLFNLTNLRDLVTEDLL